MTSHRRWLAGLLALTAALVAGARLAGAQAPPGVLDVSITDGKDSPETGEFKWYVTITDADGQPVKGLQREHFSLSEKPGRSEPRPITDFAVRTVAEEQAQAEGTPEAGPPPMSIALAIDKSDSIAGSFAELKQAAADFVDGRPAGDEIALFAFGTAVEKVQDFTTDKALLKERIAGLQPGGKTALYEAIHEVASAVNGRGERRAFVVLTDGHNDSTLSRTKDQAIQAGRESKAPGYMLGYGSALDSVLGEVADKTGGRYRERPKSDDVRNLFGDLSDLLDNQYTLTYKPEVVADETRYTFEVRVKAPAGEGSDQAGIYRDVVTAMPSGTVTAEASPTEADGTDGKKEDQAPLLLLITAGLLALLALAVGVAWWRRRPPAAEEGPTTVYEDPSGGWRGAGQTDTWSTGPGGAGGVSPVQTTDPGAGGWPPPPAAGPVPEPLPSTPRAPDTHALDQGPETVFLGAGTQAGAWLEVARGGAVGQRYPLAADEQRGTSIGRQPGNTILLNEPSVSRQHVVVRWRDGQFYLFNLSNNNPALVNGQPAHGRALRDQDRISLGRVELVFRHPGSGGR